MWSWLAPFIVTGVVGALYAAGKRESVLQNANFIMFCILATAIVSIIANVRLGIDWLDYATWVVGAIAICLAIWKILSSKPKASDPKDRGPLERADYK